MLFILALARNIVLLLAYPPAHGADSLVYFVYAERFLGFNGPAISDLAPPLYPVLILLAFKLLGSIYWLIALQLILSMLLPVLGYWIGKRYQPALGLVIGLIILGDVQVAVLYNFTSTEPLYIFLLMVTFWLYLRVAYAAKGAGKGKTAFLVGMLLELLTLTRAVGRYLILPLAIIFALMTRRYRLAACMVAGFLATIVVYMILTVLVFGQVEGFTTSNINMITVLRVKPDWIQPENGTNSATYLDVLGNCEHLGYFGPVYCLRETLGGWDQTQ